MLKNSENIITVSGGKIWSEKIFKEGMEDKTPIIFLHGGPGSTHDKIKWGLKPLANNYPLIFYDQLGGGNSRLPVNQLNNNLWQVERFVLELEELIKFYQIESFHLFGTSWGATLAMEYLLSSMSPKAKSVIFSSPMLSTSMWIKDAKYLMKLLPPEIYTTLLDGGITGKTDTKEYKAACEMYYNNYCLRIDMLTKDQVIFNDSLEEKFNLEAYMHMWGPSEFYASGSLIAYERFDDLVTIKVPTLFLCGEFDEATPKTVELFHKQVPNSKFHIFKRCSHQAYFEDPESFRKVLLSFLDSIN